MERRVLVVDVADGTTVADIKRLFGLFIPEKHMALEEIQDYPFERSIAFDPEILYWYNELVYFLAELEEYQHFAFNESDPEDLKTAKILYSKEDLVHLATAIVEERMEDNEATEERNQILRSHISDYFNDQQRAQLRLCKVTIPDNADNLYLFTDAPKIIIDKVIHNIQSSPNLSADELDEVLQNKGYRAEWFNLTDSFDMGEPKGE